MPRRIPRDSVSPMPIMSIRPFSAGSPTTHLTLLVPISNPTAKISRFITFLFRPSDEYHIRSRKIYAAEHLAFSGDGFDSLFQVLCKIFFAYGDRHRHSRIFRNGFWFAKIA